MPNQRGKTKSFDYQESSGVYRTARLTSVTLILGIGPIGIHADDPSWQVRRKGETGWNGDFDWLTYLGTDGNSWQTYVHCSATGDGNIASSFESKRDGGFNNSSMRIVDWDGHQWTVEVQGINGSGPDEPSFVLS